MQDLFGAHLAPADPAVALNIQESLPYPLPSCPRLVPIASFAIEHDVSQALKDFIGTKHTGHTSPGLLCMHAHTSLT